MACPYKTLRLCRDALAEPLHPSRIDLVFEVFEDARKCPEVLVTLDGVFDGEFGSDSVI
jgi:hypothetical protein